MEKISASLKEANYLLIIISFLLSFANILLQFFKWKIICNKVIDEKSDRKILSSLLIGIAGGLVTPFRAGEYIGRNLPFKNNSVIEISLATFVDKICNLFIILLVGSFATLLFVQFYYNLSIYFVLLIATLLISLFFLCFLLIINGNFRDIFKTRIKKFKWFTKYFNELKILKNISQGLILEIIFLSLLIFGCYIMQFALLISAFSHQFNFINYVWIGILVIFAKTIIPPITFGELGIRESASVFYITKMGLVAAVGFNAAIFLFLINILIPSIVGIFFLLKRDRQ